MQAAQDPAHREGVIVLHECFADAYFCKCVFVIALQKKSTLVFKDFGLEQQRAGKRSFENLHASVMVRIRALSASVEGTRRSGCCSWRRPPAPPARRSWILN